MLKTIKIFQISILIVILVITVTKGINEKTEDEKKACKKESRRVLKQIVKEVGICNSEMKKMTKDSAEHSKKMNCVVKCVLEMEHMLDKNQMITDETIDTSIGTRATERRRADVVKLITGCKTKYGHLLDPADPLCVMYGKIGLCIQGAVADMCDQPPEF